jgi:transposase
MARLGIRDFNPASRKAPERIAKVRTPEGKPIPPNTLDELKRDMTHLRFISDQIDEVEKARLARLRKEPKKRSHAMVLLLARIRLGIETADMLTHEAFLRNLRAALCRSHRCARRKRREASGEMPCANWEFCAAA